jgi:hypothetical protein
LIFRRVQSTASPLSTGEHILSFFQSLVPGYDPLAARQQPAARRGGNNNNNEEEEEDQAAAAVARLDPRQLIDTLREFLANVDHDRAGAGDAAPQNEPDEPQDLDEFD